MLKMGIQLIVWRKPDFIYLEYMFRHIELLTSINIS